MTNATTATAALKSTDGKAWKGGLGEYFTGHQGAKLRDVMRATDRRRDAACEMLGIDKGEYNRRSESLVEALLVRYPAVAAAPFGRALAFAYVSHRAVADARKALAAKAAEASAAEITPSPVEVVTADVERAAIVAEAAPAVAPEAPAAPAFELAPVTLRSAPANDVAPLPPAPGGVPSAGAVWALLRAEGIRRCREVEGAWRVVYVTRIDERFGLTAVVTHPGDFDAVRRVLASFGLPLAERDVPSGGRHFELFAAAPLATEPMTPAVRWPGRDDYMPAVEAAQ